MPPSRDPREFALDVVRTLRNAGHQALFAGGCVRDELLRLVPKDYDVATSARPEQVQALFRRTVAVGAAFGVIDVLGPRPLNVQVATFRSDGAYIDGRHPESVVFSSAEEDAQRRDFTINGMFFDPLENQVIDYVGGQADLAAKKLRAIGNAHERFREDRLRMLRAIRLAARFSFVIDEATQDAVRQMSPQLGNGVSAERIAEELRKILTHPNRVGGMQLFVDLGLAAAVMPELMPMCGLPQGLPRADGPPLPPPGMPGAERLPNDLWEHTLSVLAHLPTEASFPLALAAVLHDVGKPRTVGRTPDRYTFHGHEHVGRRVAETISNRLKLSNQERERIEWLVEKHQILAESAKMRPAKLKPLLVHPGIAELFDLHEADALASGRGIEHVELAKQKRREWEQEGSLWPEPLITGENLMQEGLQPGPIFKTLLEEVRNAQLDGTIHTQSEAIQLVRERLKGA